LLIVFVYKAYRKNEFCKYIQIIFISISLCKTMGRGKEMGKQYFRMGGLIFHFISKEKIEKKPESE
jgi:hypothetical protein